MALVKRWIEVLSDNQLVQISSSSDRSYYSSGGYRSQSRLYLFSSGVYSWGFSSSVYLDTYNRQSGPAGGASVSSSGSRQDSSKGRWAVYQDSQGRSVLKLSMDSRESIFTLRYDPTDSEAVYLNGSRYLMHYVRGYKLI